MKKTAFISRAAVATDNALSRSDIFLFPLYRVTKVTYRTQQIGGIQHAFFPSLAFLWRVDGFPKFHGFCRGKQSARLSAVAHKRGSTRTPYEITERRPQKLRTRNISVPFRVTEKELQEIDRKAAKAKLSRTEYLIACALGKQITLVEDLKPLLAEMRRIGNNINQLTKLANMGKIRETNLTEAKETLEQIYVAIYSLARGGDKHWQSS